MTTSKLFTPITIGPLTLRNRTIRSAAYESMCPGHRPSEMLLQYHRSVAAGGVGITTVADTASNPKPLAVSTANFGCVLKSSPTCVG